MKKFLFWVMLLVAGTTLQQCKNDAIDPTATRKVQFTFGFRSAQPSGGRTEGAASPTTLLLSVENSIGDPVFTNKRIALLHVGASLMTEPIEMAPGTYDITDFILINDDDAVLYATPKFGSPMAEAVEHPLPYSFTVADDEVTNIAMEVVDVSGGAPEDFGYVTFDIGLVNTLQIAVFIPTGEGLSLTTAAAGLFQADNVVGNYSLEAGTNIITFQGDPDATYRLMVDKPGYPTYVNDFVYSDLVASLDGKPLKIVLNPFTILAYTDESGFFTLGLTAYGSGGFHIDWGDGTAEDLTSGPFEHTYAGAGQHLITVTGPLHLITGIKTDYVGSAIDAIDLRSLPHLSDLRILLTRGPETIDIRQNHELTFVSLEGVRELKHLLLAEDNQIVYLDIDGPNQISTADIDAIIQIMHTSSQHGPSPGPIGRLFRLDKSWMTPTGDIVGPPSPASVEMLQDMRDHYDWTILPDPGS